MDLINDLRTSNIIPVKEVKEDGPQTELDEYKKIIIERIEKSNQLREMKRSKEEKEER